jgi:diacylglycerol kinase (ATP)
LKQALLIVNPHSGRKNGVKAAEAIRGKLAVRGIESRIFLSPEVSAMERFVEETSLGDFDFVGLVGGDGTMHSFLNAALRRYDRVPVPVALFPCGTGNAFNTDIGCGTIDETLSAIYANKPVDVDVAEVHCGHERYWSFNILGCGLVAEINQLAENLRWLGASRYTIASLVKLLANPHSHLRITTEQGDFDGQVSFVLACNTRYTGKGMLMAPHAQLSDGKFDVIIVKACSALTLLRLFPKIFRGQHLDAGVLRYLQTGHLTVRSTDGFAMPTNIDGELKGQLPFTLTVRNDKVKVFVK